MKLRKAKRFNTVESYAVCACTATTCYCNCICERSSLERDATASSKADSVYYWNYYDADASYNRG